VGGGLSPYPLQGFPAAPRRRAPPRGVDVKPSSAGFPDPDFYPDLRIFPKIGLFASFCPGSYRAKIPKKSKKWPFLAIFVKIRLFAGKPPFWGFWALFGPSRAGVLHQPPGEGPVGPGRPRGGPGRLREAWEAGSPGSGIPEGSPPAPGQGSPGPGDLARSSPDGSGDRGRPPPRTGFYINPSRRGPVPGRGGSGSPPGPGVREEPSGAPRGPFFNPPPNPGTGPRREGLM